MAYTATDNLATKTTAAVMAGATSLPVLNAAILCNSSTASPAWVQIKSNAGTETVKVTGCTSGVPNISAATLGHAAGACVVGFTFPSELICEMMKACGVSPCNPLEIAL